MADVARRPGARRPDLLGVVDSLMIRWTLGGATGRALQADAGAWAAAILANGDPATGRFPAPGSWHLWEHTTAYALAGLALVGHHSPWPLRDLHRLASPDALERWLGRCGWEAFWIGSHQVGGLAAAAHLQGAAPEWFTPWFETLERWVDPGTGLWARGWIHRVKPAGLHELAGAAHLWWVFAHRGRPVPYPERVVDVALRLQRPSGLWGRGLPFCRELDGVWALITCSDQAGGYRGAEVRRACLACLGPMVAALNDPATLRHGYRDSHRLVGALQAVARVQCRYPALLRTPRPLRCVLDVVPWM